MPQLIIAIFIAAMLDQNIRAKTFWRMGVLVPYVMAPVAVALIFSNMFADQYGLVNNFLASIGIPAAPWHSDAFASHIAIATMVNFRWTGYNTLILLAAMQAIRVLLCGVSALGDPQWGTLHLMEGLSPAMRSFQIAKDPACKGCGSAA